MRRLSFSEISYSIGFLILFICWTISRSAAVAGAAVFFVIGYGLAKPERTRAKSRRESYERLLQNEPYGSESFRVSTDCSFYAQALSADQARACAHRVARDLSIEFLGLTVFVAPGPEGNNIPRRMGLSKDFRPSKKRSDEPLDAEEQRFWPTFQKLKIKSAIEAKENGLPDVDKAGTESLMDGTEVWEKHATFAVRRVFRNEIFYFKGQQNIRREWKNGGLVSYQPEIVSNPSGDGL